MITIFTPTYNRRELLNRLYNSLMEQSLCDFEWLIVDDCSTDHTDRYIASLKNSPFPIRYYKTEKNSGKHIAYNLGIKRARGEFFICVDSDDFITNNAIEIINEHIKQNRSFVGYIFPQIHNSALDNSNWNKIDEKMIDIIDVKEIYGIKETSIVINRSVLVKHLFPESYSVSHSENFCPESILYNALINDGKFMAINNGFYISEYQESGLTSNIFNIWLKNPEYVLLDFQGKYKVLNKYNGLQRLISKSKCIININSLCLKKKMSIIKYTPSFIYSVILFFPSVIFSKWRFR